MIVAANSTETVNSVVMIDGPKPPLPKTIKHSGMPIKPTLL